MAAWFNKRRPEEGDGVPEHLRPTLRRIRDMVVTPPPSPWKLRAEFSVGGLESVGFGRKSELLLVTSSTGLGVFDVGTGTRVARDPDGDVGDEHLLEAHGIGPLDGQRIRMSGMHGGGLPQSTHDGWFAESVVADWPRTTLLLVEPGSWILGDAFGKPAAFTKIAVEDEVRAWGFSDTGKSLVLAISSTLTLFGR